MIATFYNFDKRKNSTARPAATSGTDITVELKEGADLDAPVFLMQTNVLGYTYMKWNDHYYFITGRKYLYNNYYEISCEIDVLGSYRGSIKASTQYVLRTSAAYNDDIFDNFYPLKVNPDVTITEADMGFVFSGLDGNGPTYLVTVKGGNGSEVYAMSGYLYQQLAAFLYGKTQSSLWGDMTVPIDFLKTFVDPFSYVTDVRVIPIKYSSVSGTAVPSVTLGYWEFADPEIGSKRVSNTVYTSGIITGDIAPEPTGRKAFLASNKARGIEMFIPGCGMQSFDADKCKGATNFHVNYSIDKKGVIAYYVYINDEVHYCSADISLPIAVYSNISNIGGAISGITRLAGGVAAGFVAGNVPGAVIGGITGAVSGVASASPLFSQQTLGCDGSWAALASQPKAKVMVTQYDIPDQAPQIYGYPYCATMTLSSNGYYLIKDPQVAFGDDTYIKDAIKNFMESGFYIE